MTTPDPKESFIPLKDITLHAITSGPQDGHPVILLHGFPEFWYGWHHQIEPLAQAGYRVIVPDQRGYNLSDKPRGVVAYRLETLAADVVGLIDWAGREKAVVIGHDWGAAVAWAVALIYPRRVEKLGILNVPHPEVMRRFVRTSLKQMFRSWYIVFFQVPGLADWLLSRSKYAGLTDLLVRSGKAASFSRQDLDQYRLAWSQPGALTAMINWYRAIGRYPLSLPASPLVHVPTLMLWGMQDVALSYEMATPSIELCDTGRLVLYPKASHWVQLDEADDVTSQLLAFLAE